MHSSWIRQRSLSIARGEQRSDGRVRAKSREFHSSCDRVTYLTCSSANTNSTTSLGRSE